MSQNGQTNFWNLASNLLDIIQIKRFNPIAPGSTYICRLQMKGAGLFKPSTISVLHHIENSPLICSANQLNDFHMMRYTGC